MFVGAVLCALPASESTFFVGSANEVAAFRAEIQQFEEQGCNFLGLTKQTPPAKPSVLPLVGAMPPSLDELLLKAAAGVSVVVEFGDNAGKRVFQLGALTAELFNCSLSSLLSKDADSLTPLATNHIKAAEELAKRQRAEELRRELEEEEAEAEAAAAAAAAAAARKAAADARRDALRRELEGLGPPAEAQSVQGASSSRALGLRRPCC